MAPTTPTPSSPKTTAAGIISMVLGLLTLAFHGWAIAHGHPPSPEMVGAGVAAIAGGAGLVKAQDAPKQ